MKIVFLDFDGPLIPGKCGFINNKYKNNIEMKNDGKYNELLDGNFHYFAFDQFVVDYLNSLCYKHDDIHFVLHTSWRKFYPDDFIFDLMKYQGLNLRFHEDYLAPFKFSSNRWNEISFWMDDHKDISKENIVILDDENCRKGYEYADRLVLVDYDNGLSYNNVKKINQLLNI